MKVTLEKRADQTEQRLRELVFHRRAKIDEITYYKTPGFKKPDNLNYEDFKPCDVGFTWKRNRKTDKEDRLNAEADLTRGDKLPAELSLGDSVWFGLKFDIPGEMKGRPVFLRFSAKPLGKTKMGPEYSRPGMEALCYRDGEPWQAFDEGRDDLLLTEKANGGESFDLLVEVGTTMLWGGLHIEEFKLESAEIYSERPKVKEFYWTYKLLNDLRKDIDDHSPTYNKLLRKLNEADKAFPIQSNDEEKLAKGAIEALDKLEPAKSYLSDLSDYKLITIGHAHIDSAWLWPWSETIRKVGRTFSNVLKLMEEYPSFRFLQSQPHLYEFVKNRYPSLFEKIKKKVEEGRWEPVGALWVESDVNIPGPEGLARQFLMGKRYFREEFGVDPKIIFLPDVFGYSPSLPGIANAADCPYFLTQKMCWNERNEIPHHAFRWEGIDGSEVLAHFLPADTYNGRVTVEEVRKTAREFKEGDFIWEVPYLIGWGDGGGGPTREMVEKMEQINEIDYLPDMEFGSLKEVFSRLKDIQDNLDKWVGELYLERHRGTLTTQAKVKKKNRKAEYALREAEIWSVVGMLKNENFQYPSEGLEKAWKIVLFNQFHDILPGSSVREVYEDTERDYGEGFDIATEAIDRAIRGAVDDSIENEQMPDYIRVTNSLSWKRTSPVKLSMAVGEKNAVKTEDGTVYPLQKAKTGKEKAVFLGEKLPSLGMKTFELVKTETNFENEFTISKRRLENSQVRVEFDDWGVISSLFDKVENRQVLSEERGNELRLYRDIPMRDCQDAWDIDEDIYDQYDLLPPPKGVEVMESGPVRAVLRQVREFGNSSMVQDIIIYKNSKRIDFSTNIDWKEEEKLLKVHFPIGVHTNQATFEVQFGHYKRPTHNNTSWDEARFEVPHQKWVDVSEFQYGTALLNDCKYGVNLDGTEISLSLLRAPNFPDPKADREEHEFTYSLLPHRGDFREAGIIKEAYQLNIPTRTIPTKEFTDDFSLFEVEGEGVIVEAVKKAEDDEGIILRLYEAWGRTVEAAVSSPYGIKEAYYVNLVEDKKESLEILNGSLQVKFSPFEIKSIWLTFK